MGPMPAIDDDVWELYGPDDWSQANDLAAEQPERLAYLQRLFLIEATKHNVLPLDDRRVERFDPGMAGRPSLIHGTRQLLYAGMGRLSENSVVNIKNKSHAITAQVTVPAGTIPDGVLIAQGGAFGGWALYVTDGRPAYCYNLFGLQRFKVYGGSPLTEGDHQVRAEFAYDGGGLGKGGTATLYVDGVQVGDGRVDATQPLAFSADETTDVGSDSATPVSDDYGPKDSRFNGRIAWIQIDLGEDAEDADHLISPEERYRVAMARQ
jgi:arylsulfatase